MWGASYLEHLLSVLPWSLPTALGSTPPVPHGVLLGTQSSTALCEDIFMEILIKTPPKSSCTSLPSFHTPMNTGTKSCGRGSGTISMNLLGVVCPNPLESSYHFFGTSVEMEAESHSNIPFLEDWRRFCKKTKCEEISVNSKFLCTCHLWVSPLSVNLIMESYYNYYQEVLKTHSGLKMSFLETMCRF